jgi:hypothetical protein
MTIMTELALSENQYISDLAIEIKHKLTHLSAPTGRGKTTFIVNELSKHSKIIMVCPVNIQVRQLASDFRDNPKVQCITGDEKSINLHGDIIICVYDRLAQLLDSGLRANHYTLVIDEAHKIYQAANYRSKALSVLVDAISDDTFKQVLTVSATFQPDIFPFSFDEIISIAFDQADKPPMEVVFYKERDFIEQYLLSIAPTEGHIAIIRLNNKEQIKHAKLCFEQKNLRVLEIHSDNQKSIDVTTFLATSLVTGFDIVLTTSLLDEAINIKNTNVESVHLFHKLHCDEINQFIGRNRKSQPDVFLHLLESELNREDIDIARSRLEVEDLCDAALNFCLKIAKTPSEFSRVVSNINITTKHCQGFEPLFYDFRERELPSINEVSVLAKLYDISMEAQYVNDDSLHFSLLGTGCFSSVELFSSDITACDDELSAIIEQATTAQDSARAAAIEACCVELGMNDLSKQVTAGDVEALASKYNQSGIKGEVTTEWSRLCLILPVDQALDAVMKGRAQAVWAFQKSIEHLLYVRPFFDKLKTDLKLHGQVKLVGADTINKYFVQALSNAASKQEGFKKFIKKLKVAGLEVQANNKFKLSSKFIYAFIRDCTEHIEYRSGGVQFFTISKIGQFGYDYNINALRSSEKKNRTRRAVT